MMIDTTSTSSTATTATQRLTKDNLGHRDSLMMMDEEARVSLVKEVG